MATHCLFFALWLPDTAARALHRQALDLTAGGGRAMRAETLHLTLAFLGEVNASHLPGLEAIGARVARGRAPFTITLDRLDRWSHNRIDWAGMSKVPPELSALAADLRAALAAAGHVVEPPVFVPHVTLARKRAAADLPCAVEIQRIEVDELRLVESRRGGQGADYAPVARWPLRAVGSPQC